MNTCSGQPVSWLVLERYCLGELSSGERREIERHLESCALCRGCLAQLHEDNGRILPELPDATPSLFQRLREALSVLGMTQRRALVGVAALAAATVLVLALWPQQLPRDNPQGPSGEHLTFKGGDLSMEIVRERGGVITRAPVRFVQGDRFKVLVTCPGDASATWDVAVFQAGAVMFPFSHEQQVRCGNAVPLAGAFGLSGEEPATICAAVNADASWREELMASGQNVLTESSVCITLDPVATPR